MADDYTEPTEGLEPTPGFAEEIQRAIGTASQPAASNAPEPEPDPVLRGWENLQLRLYGNKALPAAPAEPQDDPIFGRSPLARELEESGWFATREAEHAAERDQERQRAVTEVDEAARDAAPYGGESPPEYAEATRRMFGGVGEAGRATVNLGGQLPGSVVVGTGSLVQAPSTFAANIEFAEQNRRKRQIEIADSVDREGTAPAPRPGEVLDQVISSFTARYLMMTPAERAIERARLQSEVAAFNPTPVGERPFYRAGEYLQEKGRNLVPFLEGYDEQSISTQLSRGLGSLIVGMPVAMLPGGAGLVGGGMVFGAMGVGEATQRAVEFDRRERAAGRPGLTQEQIILAGILGSGPGLTDLAPVEALLGRLPIPGMTPGVQRTLAQAIGALGGRVVFQALIEGGQEGFQQVLQNLIAWKVYNPDQAMTEDVWWNTVIGGGVGGIAQGAREGIRLAARRGGPAPAPTPTPTPSPQPETAAPQPAAPAAPPEAGQPTVSTPAAPEAAQQQPDTLGYDLPTVAPPAPETPPEAVQPPPAAEATPVDPEAEQAPAAAPAAPEAVPVERERLTRLPRFEDVIQRIPKDADGNPDVAGLQQRMQERYGVSGWTELNLPQRVGLFRELGVEAREREAAAAAPPATLPPVPTEPEGQLREAIDRILEDRPDEVQDAQQMAERFASPDAQARVAELGRVVEENLPRWREQFGADLRQRGISEADVARLVDESVGIIGGAIQTGGAPATLEALRKYAYEEGQRAALDIIDARPSPAAGQAQPVTEGIAGPIPAAGVAGRGPAAGGAPAGGGGVAAPAGAPAARAEPAAAAGPATAGGAGAAPGAAAQPAGAQRAGAAPAGTGTERAGPGTAAAAQPTGGAERGVRAGGVERAAEPVTTDQRTQLRSIIASRFPLNWGTIQARLGTTPEQMEALRQEALSEGLLRQDRNGAYRRVPQAVQPAQPDITISPEDRVEGAIRAREEQTGKPVSPAVRAYAVELLSRLGSPSFMGVLNNAKADAGLTPADARDLAAIAGTPVGARAGKAASFASVEKRHQDYVAFLEKQAAETAVAVNMASFASSASDGQSQRAELDALGFYSKALEAAKAWPQTKGTPEQILKHLKSSGVKDNEIAATRLDKFLQQKTREAVEAEERPVAAAVTVNGQVFRGPIHNIAVDEARNVLGRKVVDDAIEKDVLTGGGNFSGFVTNRGRYVSREEAARLVPEAGRTSIHAADLPANNPKRTAAAASGKGTVTRDEVVSYLRENRVEVREAVYRAERTEEELDDLSGRIREAMIAHYPTMPVRNLDDVIDAWRWEGVERDPAPETRGIRDGIRDLAPPHIRAMIDDLRGAQEKTRWSQHSIDPSNPTYRETVLHLPRRGPEPGQMLTIAERRAAAAEMESNFISGHFPEPNIIADIMSSLQVDKDGDTTFVPSQIQSDWSQSIRDRTRDAVAKALFGPESDWAKARTADLRQEFDAAQAEYKRVSREHTLQPSGLVDDSAPEVGRALRARNIAESRLIIQRDFNPSYRDLNPDQKKEVSAAISEARQRGEIPAGARDERKIQELKKQEADLLKQHEDVYEKAKSKLGSVEFQSLFEGTGPRANSGERVYAELAADDKAIVDDYNRLHSERGRVAAEIRTAEAATPSHPLVNTTDQWLTTTLRHVIRQAIAAGAKSISIPSGDTVLSYNPQGSEEGNADFYDNIVPLTLRKILQGIDKSIKPHKVDTVGSPVDGSQLGKGFTVFPITEKVKERVETDHLQLMAISARQERGAAYQAWSQGRSYSINETAVMAALEALEPFVKTAPSDVAVRVLYKVEPFLAPPHIITQRVRDGRPIENLRAYYVDHKGLVTTELFFVPTSADILAGPFSTNAIYSFESRRAGGLRNARISFNVFGHIGTSQQFIDALRGQLGHELVHALRQSGRLVGWDWATLVSASHEIDLLGKSWREWGKTISEPNWEIFDTKTTVEETYRKAYKNNTPELLEEFIDQEAVAHTLQAFIHGAVPAEALGEAQAIFERILAGEFGRGPVQTSPIVVRGAIAELTRGASLREPSFEPFPNTPTPAQVHLSSEEGQEALDIILPAFSPLRSLLASRFIQSASGVANAIASEAPNYIYDRPSTLATQVAGTVAAQYAVPLKKAAGRVADLISRIDLAAFAPANGRRVRAAISINGEVFTAPNHVLAMEQAADKLGQDAVDAAYRDTSATSGFRDGFVDEAGNFLTRAEAAAYLGLVEPGEDVMLSSEQVRAMEPRAFSVPGFDGSVTEKVKEGGERLRTYSAGGSDLIVSEQPDGSWELTFFRAEDASRVPEIVAAIEQDIGKPISPRGWLTPEGYQYWLSVAPEKVRFHVNAGELFGGMVASPRAVEFAEAVLAEAVARQRADTQPVAASPISGVAIAELPDGNPSYKNYDILRDGRKIGNISIDPERSIVTSVEIFESQQKQGIGSYVYDLVEARLGLRLRPSTYLSEGSYGVWRRRRPSSVEGYTLAEAEDFGGETYPQWSNFLGRARAHLSRLKSSIPQEAFTEARREERYSLAAEPPLDMSPEARKARAEEMGFDTSRVWYHGTDAAFSAFDKSFRGSVTGSSDSEVAFWFSEDIGRARAAARDAMDVSGVNVPHFPEGVLSAYVRLRNPLVIDTPLVEYDPEESADLLQQAEKDGHDGVIFAKGEGAGADLAVFDPSNIRSTNAAFDPSQEGSPVLLASFSGRGRMRGMGGRRLGPSDYNRILEAQRATEGFRAAMRDPQTGKVYVGATHQAAIDKVPPGDETGAWGRLQGEWDRATDNSGFVDAKGRFITRTEAERRYGLSTMEDLKDLRKGEPRSLPGKPSGGSLSLEEDDDGTPPITLASFSSGPQLPNTQPSQEVRGLSDIISDLKSALGLTTTQGLYGMRVKDRAAGRTWGFRPRGIRSQYDANAGVARIRIATDIDAIAKEGGRHVERVFGAPMQAFLQQHAEELATPAATDTPLPPLNPTGYSGLELDADTQRVLVDTATNLRAWQALARTPTRNAVAYREATERAAIPAATLRRRLGRTIADALVTDLIGMTGRPEVDYVRERYSPTGTPSPRVTPTPTTAELSEGFADFFRRYITDPDGVKREMPGVYTEFENFLDANDPAMLQDLERVQVEVLSADYKAYRLATAVEQGTADVATMQPESLGERLADWYQTGRTWGGRWDLFKQWLSHVGSSVSYEMTDRTNPILKTQQALLRVADANGIRDSEGRPISLQPSENAHRIARMQSGADKIGHQMITHGVPDYQGLEPVGPSLHDALVLALGGTRAFQWNDKAIKRFGLYLEARRAVAEWPRFLNGDISQPTRRSLEKNQKIIADLEAANPNYGRAAQMVYDWQHRLLTLEYMAGKWTKAAYDELSKRKDSYVPFMRDLSDLVPMAGAPPGSRMATRFTEGKRFKGSQRDIINPIESLIKRAHEVAAAVQFNDMVKALANLSERAGPGGAGFVERVQKEEALAANERTFERIKQEAIKLGVDPADAHMIVQQMELKFTDSKVNVLWDPDNMGPGRPPIVPLWENGERKLVRLNDPILGQRLFEAMNALGREQTNFWMRAIAWPITAPASILRAGVTMHPAFVISNVLADMQAAWALTGAPPIITQAKGAFYLLATNPTVNAVMRSVGITPPKLASLYATVGGIAGGQNVAAIRAVGYEYDIHSLRQKGYHVLNLPALGGLGMVGAGVAAGGMIAGPAGATVGASVGAVAARIVFGQGAERAFAQLTEMSETVTRLGVAAHAAKRARRLYPNMSDIDVVREAAFTARDVIDFDRAGARAGTLLKLIPFLNSNLQGVSKAYRQSLLMDGERGRVNMEKVRLFLRWQLTGTGAFQQKVSARDQQAIRDGARLWVNMMILAAVATAISFLFADDPEYDDVRKEVRNTHYVFKLWGTWYRIKKPFELAHFANIGEAFYAWMGRNDPRLMERVWSSFRETHMPPFMPQGYNLVTGWVTGVDPGRPGSREPRPIVPDGLSRLPASEQYNAYTSAFALAWSRAMEKVGLTISPMMIDWTLNNELAYWGREIRVTSDYFFSERAPQWTDTPIIGTVLNRFTHDPSRSSQSIQEFWALMGRGKGEFDEAFAGYDALLKRGNPNAVMAYLAGLSPEERTYSVLQRHFSGQDQSAHPLNRANIIYRVNSGMRREMAEPGGLIDTSPGARGESILLAPAKRAEVDNILGRLSAIEAWNALHLVGRPGWGERQVRDPQPVLDELMAASPEAYREMLRRRQNPTTVGLHGRVGTFDEDVRRWREVERRVNKMIEDENMLGTAWDKTFRNRRAPTRQMEMVQ